MYNDYKKRKDRIDAENEFFIWLSITMISVVLIGGVVLLIWGPDVFIEDAATAIHNIKN